MTTHIIYHIPGRKVGCTRDLRLRKSYYLLYEGKIPEIDVIEELHDKTDQEAGDIERAWSIRLGYGATMHYAHTMVGNVIGGVNRARALSQETEVIDCEKGRLESI
jgi:hypothetical protein